MTLVLFDVFTFIVSKSNYLKPVLRMISKELAFLWMVSFEIGDRAWLTQVISRGGI
jgi:hypothetical protein